MARKKKIVVKEESTIKYTGKVKIKKVKNGKVVSEIEQHNKGTNYLFNFLLNCLAGNYIEQSRPFWVMCTNKQEDGTYKVASSTIRPILSATLVEDYIEYTFFLPFKQEFLTGFDSLLIYNTLCKPNNVEIDEEASAEYSMEIIFQDKVIAESKEDIIISWQLKVSNE